MRCSRLCSALYARLHSGLEHMTRWHPLSGSVWHIRQIRPFTSRRACVTKPLCFRRRIPLRRARWPEAHDSLQSTEQKTRGRPRVLTVKR